MPLNIDNFAVRYGWDPLLTQAQVVDELAAIDTDLLIMGGAWRANAGADNFFTPADIAEIKAGTGGKTIIGYMSVGAVLSFQDNYSSFEPFVFESLGSTKFIAYWDPAGEGAVNPGLLAAFEGWVDQLKAQGFDGAFLDVPTTYVQQFVQDAIPGASMADDYIIAIEALMTLVADLKDHAGADFKLIFGHGPYMINDYRALAGSGADAALIERFRAALDGVLTESLHFPSQGAIDTYITNSIMQPNSPNGFGDATPLVIDYFDAGGAFDQGEALAADARLFQIEAALAGFVPYAVPTTASGDGVFGSTYGLFNVATAAGDALLAETMGSSLAGLGGDDYLRGQGGADALNGGAGADIMRGGGGNDTYYVDALGDTTEEAVNAGTDTVVASRSWAVASNIERVFLSGGGDFNVAGNGLANNLRGNSGDNWLNGSFGKDTLTGGGGRDSFIFNRTLGPNNVDTITDYDVVRDVIRIDNAVFAGIGPAGALAAGAFNTGAAATQADDRIIYDQTTGRLFFDIDGAGGQTQVHFATLSTKPAGMSAAEFIII